MPGVEIPSRYFDYLRSGDPAPIRDVLSHNRLDLASLAILTGLACELVDGGPDAAHDARQRLGLGRVYERGGRRGDAYGCYERAAGLTAQNQPDAASLETGLVATEDPHHRLLDVRAEALYRVASARRRQRRYVDAARVWDSLLSLGTDTRAVRARGAQGSGRARGASIEGHGEGAHLRTPGLRGGAHGDWPAGWAETGDAAGTAAGRNGCERCVPHTDGRNLIGSGRLRGLALLLLAFLEPGDGLSAVLLHEPLDTALGIDQLLLAGEEGVAIRTDFESKLRLGRSRCPRCAAGTVGLDIEILRVNSCPHNALPFQTYSNPL